ncbi:hypothetical protein STEG23_012460, partial [Scotinomys teguina]
MASWQSLERLEEISRDEGVGMETEMNGEKQKGKGPEQDSVLLSSAHHKGTAIVR